MSELDALLQTMLSKAAKGERVLGGRQPSVPFGGPGFVNINIVGGGKFREMGAKLSIMRKAYRIIGRLGQRMVGEEFDRSAKRGARGGFSKWRRTKKFGSREAPGQTGTASGELANAWAGKGPGAIFRVLAKGVNFGARVAHAAPFREGWKQTVTDRQRMFLGLEFGVWLKPGQEISSPARPHAEFTKNVAFLRDSSQLMLAHAAGATQAQLASVRGMVRVA